MWLGLPAFLLVVLAIIGAIIGGGIFTIVLLPVAVLVLIGAMVFGVWSRAQASGSQTSHAAQTGDPLPHGGKANTPASPATPEQLVDARRGEQ